MSFSCALAEPVGDEVAPCLCQVLHAATLGEILSDEAVGILVDAALERVLGRSEIGSDSA